MFLPRNAKNTQTTYEKLNTVQPGYNIIQGTEQIVLL